MCYGYERIILWGRREGEREKEKRKRKKGKEKEKRRRKERKKEQKKEKKTNQNQNNLYASIREVKKGVVRQKKKEEGTEKPFSRVGERGAARGKPKKGRRRASHWEKRRKRGVEKGFSH